MNNDAQKSEVDNELANRLDALFDEDGPGENPVVPEDHAKDPLDELASLVMSIEWEITDDVMESFLSQIDALKTYFGEDRILIMFLQLLGSLGLYIKTNKSKAHPVAFKLINSVYSSFKKAASQEEISPSEKKKLLYAELNKYKELKEKIDSNRRPEVEPSRAPETAAGLTNDRQTGKTADRETFTVGSNSQKNASVTQQHFDETIGDLKSLILKEFASLREDIDRLKKTK